jgi:hypothetical protein
MGKSQVAEAFYAVLRWQANQPACWFRVPYVEDHSDKGLWELCGLKKEAYYLALQSVGIGYKHGKNWRIRREKVMHLGTNANLEEGSFYASTFKMDSVMFIRLGHYKDELRFNPDDADHAFASFQKAPNNLLSALSLQIEDEDDATGVLPQSESPIKEASSAHDLQMQLLELINLLLSGEAQKLSNKNRFWKRGLTDDALLASLSTLIFLFTLKK